LTAWRGRPWRKGSSERAAHPNSRFTAPAAQCPSISPRFDDPHGVPISAVVFGGRRARTAPLVLQAFDWSHGVFVGASVASETTAAQSGAVGVVRRDPMAMLPFCGYNMADYFGHWLEMGKAVKRPPAIFHVNWFRQDAEGRFIWPGFGENMRVLRWIVARAKGAGAATESPIGMLPAPGAIDTSGLEAEGRGICRPIRSPKNRSRWPPWRARQCRACRPRRARGAPRATARPRSRRAVDHLARTAPGAPGRIRLARRRFSAGGRPRAARAPLPLPAPPTDCAGAARAHARRPRPHHVEGRVARRPDPPP